MATHTPNLNLIKPEDSDFFSKDHQNDNMDKIDTLAVIKGIIAPTTATVGVVGQLYLDTVKKTLYQCTLVNGANYTWAKVVSQWKLLQAYITAGSFTFTTPEGVSEIGAFIIGGGGSGLACIDGNLNYINFGGGASGRTKTIIKNGVLSPTYPVVVGAGGAVAVKSQASGCGSTLGNAGGSSSFAGVVAIGGEGAKLNSAVAGGGQGARLLRPNGYQATQTYLDIKLLSLGEISPIGGTDSTGNISSFWQGETHPAESFNLFESKFGLIAGGGAARREDQYEIIIKETINVTDDYGLTGSVFLLNQVGTAANQIATATKGTSYGCGGGSVFCKAAGAGTVATSAAGCAGAVLIYGR